MNRIAGIIVAAIGILLVVAGLMKVLPGVTGTGAWGILVGIVLVALSFIEPPNPEDTPRMSTGGTLGGIFFSPGEVFANLRRHPRWLVAVIVMVIASTIFSNLFMERLTPERITNYAIDKTLEMPLVRDNTDAVRQVELGRAQAIADAKNPVTRVATAFSLFGSYIIGIAVLSGLLMLFLLVFGGRANFWQIFSAVTYAWLPVSLIRSLLSTIILFIKDPNTIHPLLGQQGGLISDNLGILVTPSASPALYALLSSIGIITFYWLWLNATGLKEAGEKVSGSSAWTATIILWVLGLLLAAVSGLLFPSFMS